MIKKLLNIIFHYWHSIKLQSFNQEYSKTVQCCDAFMQKATKARDGIIFNKTYCIPTLKVNNNLINYNIKRRYIQNFTRHFNSNDILNLYSDRAVAIKNLLIIETNLDLTCITISDSKHFIRIDNFDGLYDYGISEFKLKLKIKLLDLYHILVKYNCIQNNGCLNKMAFTKKFRANDLFIDLQKSKDKIIDIDLRDYMYNYDCLF